MVLVSLNRWLSKIGLVNSFIDTDSEEFIPSGNIPKRIQEYCKRTGQYIPQNEAEIVRCIDQSLAIKYRFALEQIEMATGKKYDTLNIIGGGIQSKLLCQLTANICGRKVIAGPVEATVMGNIVLQLMALGEIKILKKHEELLLILKMLLFMYPKKMKIGTKYIKILRGVCYVKEYS